MVSKYELIKKPALRVLLGVMVGVVLVFAVQIPVTKLWGIAGIRWSGTDLPLVPGQQFAALFTLFLAVFISTVGAVWAAGDQAALALFILIAIGVGIDGFVMFAVIGKALPLWFRITFVAQIPLATLAGWMAIRSRYIGFLKFRPSHTADGKK